MININPPDIAVTSPVKCLVTDIEGTLTSTLEAVHWEAHARIAELLGLADISAAIRTGQYQKVLDVAPHFLGGPDDAIYQEFISLTRKPRYTLPDLVQITKNYYAEVNPHTKSEPRPGVINVLSLFKKHNLPVIACSVTHRGPIIKIISDAGLDNFFPPENMILREEVEIAGGKLKPDPTVYKLALKKAGTDAQNTIGCEDSLNGVKALNAAGITSVFLPNIQLPGVYAQSQTPNIFTSWENLLPIFKKLLD